MIKVTFNNESHRIKGLPMEEAWHKVCPKDAVYQCPLFVAIDPKKTKYKVISSITNQSIGEILSIDNTRV